MKHKLPNIIFFSIVFIFLCFMSFPALAEEVSEENESEQICITEETTLWEIVEKTNPDAEKIPDEVKKSFEGRWVKSKADNDTLFVAVDYKKIGVLVVSTVCMISVGLLILKKKQRR